MPEHKLIRCEADDPCRCQGKSLTHGQCPFKAVKDQSFCARHGGIGQEIVAEKKRTNAYRLQIWQQRVSDFSESESTKSLREEIGILKMLLEEVLNSCKSSADLMMYSNKITDLASRIEKLVMSCTKLEQSLSSTLDKTAALRLAARIVDVISGEISDADTIDAISSGIIDILKDTL